MEIGVALLVVGGVAYKWWNRPPTNPILPILDRVPNAPERSNVPEPPQEMVRPPSQASDEVPSLEDVVVTDPIQQVKTF